MLKTTRVAPATKPWRTPSTIYASSLIPSCQDKQNTLRTGCTRISSWGWGQRDRKWIRKGGIVSPSFLRHLFLRSMSLFPGTHAHNHSSNEENPPLNVKETWEDESLGQGSLQPSPTPNCSAKTYCETTLDLYLIFSLPSSCQLCSLPTSLRGEQLSNLRITSKKVVKVRSQEGLGESSHPSSVCAWGILALILEPTSSTAQALVSARPLLGQQHALWMKAMNILKNNCQSANEHFIVVLF